MGQSCVFELHIPHTHLKGAESKIEGQSGTWLFRVVSMAVLVPRTSPSEAELSKQTPAPAPGITPLYSLISTYYLS